MTIFELVKLTLDELYQEGLAQYGTVAKLDAEITAKLAYLKRSYEKLGNEDRKPIDYRDPATRFAYVYKYTAAHGDYVVQALEAARNKVGSNLFTGEALRLSCIGGGPGSDVVGVLRYLSEHSQEPVKKLTCYLLDGEQGWADTWTEVGDSMDEELGINVNF